jgi:cyclase
MKSKVLVIALAAVVAIGAAATTAMTQQEAQPLTIDEVADGLYMIVGPGGNVAVRVTDEGVIVVDDKFEQNYDEIMERIGEVTDQPVKYVLNTHHHGDHSGSNIHFLANSAQVIGHENVRANIIRGNQGGPPPIVFSESATVYLGGAEAQAHHLGRGHTNGDSVILFPDLGVIHTGDLFVGGSPYMDYGNGGSGAEWSQTINNILELEFETIIPGHGPVMSRDDMRAFRNNLETMIERGRSLVSEGASQDEFVEQLDLSDIGWNYSEGFAASSIPNLYDELSADD